VQRLAALTQRPTIGRHAAEHPSPLGISRERRAIEAGLRKEHFGRRGRARAVVDEVKSVGYVAQHECGLAGREVKRGAADNAMQEITHEITYTASRLLAISEWRYPVRAPISYSWGSVQIVLLEYLRDELASAPHAHLVEDRLEVILDGVQCDAQLVGYFGGG
jgi:hypothetical protein